jgi:hypothetical protein
MKFILLSLLLFSPLFGAPQEEILVIEQLIETTKKNLEAQQTLLKLVLEVYQAREAFIADPESGKLATTLVKKAMSLHSHLEKEHLSHLFSSGFLEELAFYNRVGKQQYARG